MQQFRTFPFILLVAPLALAACASAPAPLEVSAAPFLNDAAWPGSERIEIESAEEVFELGEDARAWVNERLRPIRDMDARSEALAEELFSGLALDVSYRSNANTVAAETFRNRDANCLSLSILAYALARHAGFEAEFREVDIPEYWERRNGYSVMNQHVNLRVFPALRNEALVVSRKGVELDFRPLSSLPHPPARPISRERALAMFYNNRGVDALVSGDETRAYAYFRAALLADPGLDMALSNIGLLHARHGFRALAERSFRQAVALAPDNVVATENLAMLLEADGRVSEARDLMITLKRRRENNPFFFYIRAEEALDDGQLWKAVRLFEHAIELRPHVDQFHFGAARAYLALGYDRRARHHLKLAERYANYGDLRAKYRSKLEALSSL